jgi:putative DNA primase/helicase
MTILDPAERDRLLRQAAELANGNGRSALADAPHLGPATSPAPGGAGEPGAVITTLASVARAEVSWLWAGRLARGRLTGLMGDPGVGKSFLLYAVAAGITRGTKLPGEQSAREPADVLVLQAEDGLADTLRPRLEDLGADLGRVHVLTAIRDGEGRERHPSLVDDLVVLEQALWQRQYELLIIDPINAYLGTNLDTHRDAALRGALTPVAALCERHGVAGAFTLHLNKGSRDRAIYRGNGSIAYTAAARVVLLAGQDPENPQDRAVVWVKGNLSAPAPAVGYEIKDGMFYWKPSSTLTAATLLAPDASEENRSALTEAQQFLREILADGPVSVVEVKKQARNAEISGATLRRAREQMGVEVRPQYVSGTRGVAAWEWALPVIDAHTQTMSIYNESVSENGPSAAGDEHLYPAPGTDGPLVQAVQEFGALIVGHRHTFALCCDDAAVTA